MLTYYIWRDYPSSKDNFRPYLYGMASNNRLATKIILLAILDNPKSRAWRTTKNNPNLVGENSKGYWRDRYEKEGMALLCSYLCSR
jgi:hypothetical protein